MVLSAGVVFERPTISVGCADEGAVVSISRVKCTPRSSEVSAVCKRYLYSCFEFLQEPTEGDAQAAADEVPFGAVCDVRVHLTLVRLKRQSLVIDSLGVAVPMLLINIPSTWATLQ